MGVDIEVLTPGDGERGREAGIGLALETSATGISKYQKTYALVYRGLLPRGL